MLRPTAAVAAICACFVAAVATGAPQIDEFSFAPLDDFEDATPWLKGDPDTDLAQRDAAVTTSSQVVRQGEQSLKFMVRVNWTPRPNEKYPKGWPMIRRIFTSARDWSTYDRVFFWLYTETEDQLPSGRILRFGCFGPDDSKPTDWYTLPGIVPNQWQLMSAPLQPRDLMDNVSGISFYVAEQWYQDGDSINFYIDDMRLARRQHPVILDCFVNSRVLPRGAGVSVDLRLEGRPDPAKHHVRCTVTDEAGQAQHEFRRPVSERSHHFDVTLDDLKPGGHIATIQLLDGPETVIDNCTNYFRSVQTGKRSYLSLVTFYSSHFRKPPVDALAVLDDSAYAGVAIPFWGAYHTGEVPDYEELEPHLKELRSATKIDLWPWVFSNRFVGSPEDARGHAGIAPNRQYFENMPALDLDDETGARTDMLKMWRIAIRAAREWGSPGIVLDLEAYNNYAVYRVPYVAGHRDETVSEVIRKCEAVGRDLAKIVEQEYPKCIIWTLFSRLDRHEELPGYEGPVYPTPGHFSLGFLKYAKESRLPCEYLCGGEMIPGYYNPNPHALRDRIVERDRIMAEPLRQFPDHLFLAGTISPYHDTEILTSWIKDRAGDDPELKTIGDFQPMFRTLFDAYDWVWIYASSAARTLPYSEANNRLYSGVLEAALDQSAAGTTQRSPTPQEAP